MSCTTSKEISYNLLQQEGIIDVVDKLSERDAYSFIMGALDKSNPAYKGRLLDSMSKYSPKYAVDVLKQMDSIDAAILGTLPSDAKRAVEMRFVADYALAKELGWTKFTEANLYIRDGIGKWDEIVKKSEDTFKQMQKEYEGLDVNDYLISTIILSQLDNTNKALKLSSYINTKKVFTNEEELYDAINKIRTIDQAKTFVFSNIGEFKKNQELLKYMHSKLNALKLKGADWLMQGMANTFRNLEKIDDVQLIKYDVVENRLQALGRRTPKNFEKALNNFLKKGTQIEGFTRDEVMSAIGRKALMASNPNFEAFAPDMVEDAIKELTSVDNVTEFEKSVLNMDTAKVFKKIRTVKPKQSSTVGAKMFDFVTGVNPEGKTLIYVNKPKGEGATAAYTNLIANQYKNSSVFVGGGIKVVDDYAGAKIEMDSNPNAILILDNSEEIGAVPKDVKYNTNGEQRYVIPFNKQRLYKDMSFFVDGDGLYIGAKTPSLKRQLKQQVVQFGGDTLNLGDNKAYETWLNTVAETEKKAIQEYVALYGKDELIEQISRQDSLSIITKPIDYAKERDDILATDVEDLRTKVSSLFGESFDGVDESTLKEAWHNFKNGDQSVSNFIAATKKLKVPEGNSVAMVSRISDYLISEGIQVPTAAIRRYAKSGDLEGLVKAIKAKNDGVDATAIIEAASLKEFDVIEAKKEGIEIGKQYVEPTYTQPTQKIAIEQYDSLVKEYRDRLENILNSNTPNHFQLQQAKVEFTKAVDGFIDPELAYNAVKVNTLDDLSTVFDYYMDLSRKNVRTTPPTFVSDLFVNKNGLRRTVKDELNSVIDTSLLAKGVDVATLTDKQALELIDAIKHIEDVYRKNVGDLVYAYSLSSPRLERFFRDYALVEYNNMLIPKVLLEKNMTDLPYPKDIENKNTILQEISKNMESLTKSKLDEIIKKVAPGYEEQYIDDFLPYTELFDIKTKFTPIKIDEKILKKIENVRIMTPNGEKTVGAMVKETPSDGLPSYMIGGNKTRNINTIEKNVDEFDPKAIAKYNEGYQQSNYDLYSAASSLRLQTIRDVIYAKKGLRWISDMMKGIDSTGQKAANAVFNVKGKGYTEVAQLISDYRKLSDVEFSSISIQNGNQESAAAYTIAKWEREANRYVVGNGLPKVDVVKSILSSKGDGYKLTVIGNQIREGRIFNFMTDFKTLKGNGIPEDRMKLQNYFGVELTDDETKGLIFGLLGKPQEEWMQGKLGRFLNNAAKMFAFGNGVFQGASNFYGIIGQAAQYAVQNDAIKKQLGITPADFKLMEGALDRVGIVPSIVPNIYDAASDAKNKISSLIGRQTIDYNTEGAFAGLMKSVLSQGGNWADSININMVAPQYAIEAIHKMGWMNVNDFIEYSVKDPSVWKQVEEHMTLALRQDAGIFVAGIDELAPGGVNRVFEALSNVTGYRGGWGNQKALGVIRNMKKIGAIATQTLEGRRGLVNAIANDPELQRFMYKQVYTAYIAAKYSDVISGDEEPTIDDILKTFQLLNNDYQGIQSSGYFRLAMGIADRYKESDDFSPWMVADAFLKSSFGQFNPANAIEIYNNYKSGQNIVEAMGNAAIEGGQRGLGFVLGDMGDYLNQTYQRPPESWEVIALQKPKTDDSDFARRMYWKSTIARYNDAYNQLLSGNREEFRKGMGYILGKNKIAGLFVYGAGGTTQTQVNNAFESNQFLVQAREGNINTNLLSPLKKEKLLDGISRDAFGTFIGSMDGKSLEDMKNYLQGEDVKNYYMKGLLDTTPKETVQSWVDRLDAANTKNKQKAVEMQILNEIKDNPYAGILTTFAVMNREYDNVTAAEKARLKVIDKPTGKGDDVILDTKALQRSVTEKYLQQLADSNQEFKIDMMSNVFMDDIVEKEILPDLIKVGQSGPYLSNSAKQYFKTMQRVFDTKDARAYGINMDQVVIAASKLPEDQQVMMYSELNDWVDNHPDMENKLEYKIALGGAMVSTVKNFAEFRAKFGDMAAGEFVKRHFATIAEVDQNLQVMGETIDDLAKSGKSKSKGIGKMPSIDFKKLTNFTKDNYEAMKNFTPPKTIDIFKVKGAYKNAPAISDPIKLSVGDAKSRVYFKETKQKTGQKNMTFKRISPKIIKTLSVSKKQKASS